MTRISNDSAAADSANDKLIDDVTRSEYKYGFTSDIATDIIPKGLSEDVVRFISRKKGAVS